MSKEKLRFEIKPLLEAIQALQQMDAELLEDVDMHLDPEELVMFSRSKGFACVVYNQEDILVGAACALPVIEMQELLNVMYAAREGESNEDYLYFFSALLAPPYNHLANTQLLIDALKKEGDRQGFKTGGTHINQNYMWGAWLPQMCIKGLSIRPAVMNTDEVGVQLMKFTLV